MRRLMGWIARRYLRRRPELAIEVLVEYVQDRSDGEASDVEKAMWISSLMMQVIRILGLKPKPARKVLLHLATAVLAEDQQEKIRELQE